MEGNLQGDEREAVTETVEGLCYEFLITSEGRPNWSNIRTLEQHGYEVYPTERDSFGWLCACLEVDDTTFVYFG